MTYNIQNNIDAFEFLLGKGADNTIRLLAEDTGPFKQHNGKLIAYLMEALKSLGKRDKPQATLKKVVRNMFTMFIKLLQNRYTYIQKTITNMTFVDDEHKFVFQMCFELGDVLKNYDGNYYVIDNPTKILIGNELLLNEFFKTVDDAVLNDFKKKFGKIATHKIFNRPFTGNKSYYNGDLFTGDLTKNLFKRFFENMQNNEYSTYNSILKNMKPDDNKKVSALMKDLFEKLYENKKLTSDLDDVFNSEYDDAKFNDYLNSLIQEIDKIIIGLFNERFTTDYAFLSMDDKQKIKILNDNAIDIIKTIEFDDREKLLNNQNDIVFINHKSFFDKYFSLFDENEKKIEIDEDLINKKLRLNINKIKYANSVIDNEFYGIIIDLASVLVKHKLKITQPTLVGGVPLVERELSAIEKVRNSFLSKNELNFSKLGNVEQQIYAAYDLLFDFFIDYDPNNLIDVFLKSHYSSRILPNCSKELRTVVLTHNVPRYIPKGGNAINHGALIQGIMEQLGGNNHAYDMYLSDTTLQLHNNELEHSVMSDIMRGGANLDPSLFKTVEGKIYFNDRDSINDRYCLLVELLKKFNLSQDTIDKIALLFTENMKASNQIKKLIDILKAADGLTIQPTDEEKYFIDSATGDKKKYDDIIKEIEQLKNQQNANTTTAHNATSIINIIGQLANP